MPLEERGVICRGGAVAPVQVGGAGEEAIVAGGAEAVEGGVDRAMNAASTASPVLGMAVSDRVPGTLRPGQPASGWGAPPSPRHSLTRGARLLLTQC